MTKIHQTLLVCLLLIVSLIVSLIVHKKILRSKNRGQLILVISIYLVVNYIILFPAYDLLVRILSNWNIEVYYSHSDMILFVEIYIGWFLLVLANIIVAIVRRYKRTSQLN